MKSVGFPNYFNLIAVHQCFQNVSVEPAGTAAIGGRGRRRLKTNVADFLKQFCGFSIGAFPLKNVIIVWIQKQNLILCENWRCES